ncbi:hypothetical protein [Mycolicibacterium thermoresistibile]
MGVPTHVVVYSSGSAATIGAGAGSLQFLGPLRRLNGAERWYVLLYPLPPGKSYEEVRNRPTPAYIQAAGAADAMTVETRRPRGEQWDAPWVRYVVGREHEDDEPFDVPIVLPRTTEMVSRSEVFDAEEAGKLFMSYHKTGALPPGYALRPVEGYTREGDLIDLR